MTENRAYISKESGEIYWLSETDDFSDDVPDDIEESDAYIAVPHKNDLDLGRQLALRFTAHELPDAYDTVRDFFGRRGAYRRFKNLLEATGRLDSWYAFEAYQTQEALKGWCEANQIELILDERSSCPLESTCAGANMTTAAEAVTRAAMHCVKATR